MSYLATGDYFVLLQKNMRLNPQTKIIQGDTTWNKSIFQLRDINGSHDDTNYDTTDMIAAELVYTETYTFRDDVGSIFLINYNTMEYKKLTHKFVKNFIDIKDKNKIKKDRWMNLDFKE